MPRRHGSDLAPWFFSTKLACYLGNLCARTFATMHCAFLFIGLIFELPVAPVTVHRKWNCLLPWSWTFLCVSLYCISTRPTNGQFKTCLLQSERAPKASDFLILDLNPMLHPGLLEEQRINKHVGLVCTQKNHCTSEKVTSRYFSLQVGGHVDQQVDSDASLQVIFNARSLRS